MRTPKGKTPAKKARGASPEALEPGGDSESWLSQQANQIKIFEQCIEQLQDAELKARCGSGKWDNIPPSVLCSKEIHQAHAAFLAHKYTIPKGRKNEGKKLGKKTALGVFGGIINQAYRRCISDISEPSREAKVCGGSARSRGGAHRAPRSTRARRESRAFPVRSAAMTRRFLNDAPPPARCRRHSSSAWRTTTRRWRRGSGR